MAGDFFVAVGFFEGLFAFEAGFFAGLRRGFAWRRDGVAVDAGSHDFLAAGFLAAGFAAGFRAVGFVTVFFFAGDLAAGLRAAGFFAGLRRGPVDAIDATTFAPRTPSSYDFLAAGFFFLAAAGGPLPVPARNRARSSRLALSMGSSELLNFDASYLKYSFFESLRAM